MGVVMDRAWAGIDAGKEAEWWLLANADFDYKATGPEDTPSR